MSRLRTTASRGTVLVEGRSLPARARLEPRLHAYARHGSIRRPLVVRGPTPPAWGRLIPTSAPDRRDANLTRLLAAPDGEDRAAFEDARRRDVLPQVRVLTGGEWRTAGVLRDLPSLVRRDQAVPIDLRGVEGPTLRVRIDGPPGLWSIDRAVVAFDTGEPVQETRVLLSRAVGGRDEVDRALLLRRADGVATRCGPGPTPFSSLSRRRRSARACTAPCSPRPPATTTSSSPPRASRSARRFSA